MDLKLNVMMLEVCLHLLAIQIVDVEVRHGKTSLPLLVAISKVGVVDIKDAIDEGEVVFDLLVAFDVETDMAG